MKSISKVLTVLTLMLLLTSMIFSTIIVNAQTSGLKTYAFVGATPNPVGVGQQTVFRLGITQQLAAPAYGWEGLTITVTHPDGEKETLGPFRTDSTGGTYALYIPTEVGNYTLQSHFPQQNSPATMGSIPQGQVMLASDSDETMLEVLSEPIQAPQTVPLPSEYWYRPINDQYQSWQTIGGNWLPASNTAPTYNRVAYGNDYAPKSPHLLWSRPITAGGLIGGAQSGIQGDITNQRITIGDAYQGKFLGSVIMLGNLYYDEYPTTSTIHQITAVNLHTGEKLWSQTLLNNLTLARGQLLSWNSINLVGTYPYLWSNGNAATRTLLGLPSSAGTTWCAFDPFTGSFVYALYGIPSGSTIFGENGEIIIYTVNLNAGYMTMWNSTNIPLLTNRPAVGSTDIQQWRPEGKIINATGNAGTIGLDGQPAAYDLTPTGLAGYMWNATIPKGLPGSVISVLDDRLIGGTATSSGVTLWALSTKPTSAGQLLFNKAWQPPSDWTQGNVTIAWQATSDKSKDGVVIFGEKETRQNYAFSVETGDFLWVGQSRNYLDFYTMGLAGTSARAVNQIFDGKFYSAGYAGILYCFEATTGKILWTYSAKNPTPEGQTFDTWPLYPMFIANGMIYLIHTEHSGFEQSLPPEAPMICLNATSGELVWRANGLFRGTHWGGYPIIGDSIIAAMDSYDQQIYAIGRGPSSVTVEAPLIGVTTSEPLVIQGTVNDVSPGTSQAEIKLRFPNGVPAISDANMTAWMRYVYQQLPKPSDIQGVQVSIDVIDSNGNYRNIGSTTSDEKGFFSIAWQPDIEGKYTVIANFAGSESYYPSSAAAAFYANEPAPTSSPVSVTTVEPPMEIYFAISTIAIIIAIAIVGLLILRKKP